jgi:hypothetical protein
VRGPIALLGRTFFRRLFQSELLPEGLPQVQVVIWSMAMLAAPGLLLPMRYANKYAKVRFYPDVLEHALVLDRLLFITVSMTALGIVALVVWEGLFPDKRDARILGVLPLPGRVLILARLVAVAALGAIFLIGINLVPTFTYGPIVGVYSKAHPLLGVVSHFVSTALGGAFVFCSLIALQGLLLNVAGRRVAERLSVALQLGFIVSLLQLLIFLPGLSSLVGTDLDRIAADQRLLAIPSFWFLGVSEVLLGHTDPSAMRLAAIGVSATGIAMLLAGGLFAATHARLMRMALESQDPTHGVRLGRVALDFVVRTIYRSPVQRAVFEFTVRTLVRSRTHRMLLAMYVGLGTAVVVATIVPQVLRQGVAAFGRPGVALLSAPFVLLFFSLIGVRTLIAIPVEPKANWIVRLLEPKARRAAIAGVRDVMMAVVVAPIAVVAGGSAALLWGAWPGIVHATMCLAMGWVLTEVLLLGLRKIPFTCTYFPGRSRIRMMWPLYVVAFVNYAFTTAAGEPSLMANPKYFAYTVSVLAALGGVLWMIRARSLAMTPGLRFAEEDPHAMLDGLHLSEGLAAQPKSQRASSSAT